ncbi:DNA-protecting protein DprA [Nonomuraea rhodomycinica]|uniref:DNA-protecting protein DprA n=2 Tax=Nonomuraea rhodomycinica TaxID=1712872 RepID=A0A7Y6IYD9_9ACTN|nr:DNA-protecting protein DprA [Nonomuraea rhodomycinica]
MLSQAQAQTLAQGQAHVLAQGQAQALALAQDQAQPPILGQAQAQALTQGQAQALAQGQVQARTQAQTQHQGSTRLSAKLEQRLSIWHARMTAADPAADLATGERLGARLIVPGSPEWPTQLDQLGAARPLGLWLHGSADLRFSCLRSVAIVGARSATPYGLHVAAEFALGLGEDGWTVVSGGAYGVDGAAHRGALASDTPTVVVLACGVDVAYPRGHHQLFAAAREQGVIVSECPPGVNPTRARFLIRNRLIAALSRGTVVVEAALRSGALNTAAHALTLNRHLAAVPGPVTSMMSAGCHRLLRERKATCVTTPEEVIELVGTIGGDLAPCARGPAVPRDALNEVTRKVLDAVPSRGGAGPASIALSAGVSLDATLSALGGLAAAGYVERVEKGWRLRRPASASYRKSDAPLPDPVDSSGADAFIEPPETEALVGPSDR